MFISRSFILTVASLLALTSCTFGQQMLVPLWPHDAPEIPSNDSVETDSSKPTDLLDGRHMARLTNTWHPSITIYPAAGNTDRHPAALVFPGGGYGILSWNLEGVDVCTWLNSIDVTCLLVKYRVPNQGRYPNNYGPLEDAQQAMRLSRLHAKEWKLDPDRIGVIGFSAGGNLAALMSTHSDEHHVESTPAAPDVDTTISASPNFAMLIYPAYLVLPSDSTKLDPVFTPNALTPPTFLLQAENDVGYGKNAPVYYQALAAAKIPAELHMYATGGHGFGVSPRSQPEEHWTDLATLWLRSLRIIP